LEEETFGSQTGVSQIPKTSVPVTKFKPVVIKKGQPLAASGVLHDVYESELEETFPVMGTKRESNMSRGNQIDKPNAVSTTNNNNAHTSSKIITSVRLEPDLIAKKTPLKTSDEAISTALTASKDPPTHSKAVIFYT
jgi:hypothetical protein